MFTGIIEELGTVVALTPQEDAARLTVRGSTVTEDAKLGDSISVDGCCLTVTELDGETFTADVMAVTLQKTGVHRLEPGSRVNLERSCTPTTRLGGHIVQGHVDGTGMILRRTPTEHWHEVEISLPDDLKRYVAFDGSIAVDGISLTVAQLREDGFVVSLIPETLARTTLGLKQVGDSVNLEVDIIARHVERLMQS